MARLYPLAISLSLIAGFGCDIAPNNPFDPEAPAELQEESTLSGVVSGAEGPLEGATVLVGDDELTTDEDGAYTQARTPGEVTVVVTHPAHLQFAVTVTLSPGEARTLDVTLDPIPQVENEDAGRIFGVAQRAGQLGLPAAEQDHSGIVVEVDGTGVRAVTGLDGAFDLFLTPETYSLTFSTAGHDAATRADIEVTAGEAVEVPNSPVVLSGIPGTVTGTVALEDGAAPDGVAIDLVSGGSATTGAEGTFSIGDVPAGTYLLTASKDGYEPFTFGFVTVEAGRETTLPGFILEVSRGAVIGRALLAGQADNSGIGVQLEGAGASAVTGIDGSFRIDGVREGTFTLRAFKDGFVSTTVNDVVVAANAETDVGDVTLAPQQGDFTINGGAIFTNDPVVTLELEGEGAVEMRVSEDQTFTDAALGDTAFVTFDATPSFTLSSGDGLKTLFAQLKDGDGVEGPLLVATITLDTTPPVIANVALAGGNDFTNSDEAQVFLSVDATDATSGVATMQVSNDDVLDEPFVSFNALTSHVLDAVLGGGADDPVNDGLKTVRVRVRDFAGNESTIATDDITLDRVAPTLNTFTIDCAGQTDPAFCPNAIVELAVNATDAAAMAVSNQTGQTNIFQPFQPLTAHLLVPGEGGREVFLKLRDAAGNETDEFSDTVTVDGIPPLFPSVTIAGGAPAVNTQTVTLDLAATGATFMRVAFDGVLDNEPTIAFANQLTDDLPAGDGEKTVVVVFLDDAGNLSATASDTVVLDETAPVIDNFTVNGGAAFTNDAGALVTLSLAVTDATSGATEMQISNDAVFDEPFEPLVALSAHQLAVIGDPAATANDGTKTVRVQVRDLAGNVSAPAQATIELDRAPPTLDAAFTIDCGGVANASDCTTSVVSLTIQSSNAVEMAISNLAGLPDANFIPLADGAAHILTPGDGARTAFLLLRDAAGNLSAEFSDTINVDGAPPLFPTVTIASGAAAVNDQTVTVDLAASGATRMRVAFDGVLDTEPTIDFAPQLTDDLPAGDGEKTVVAVFLDDAGNLSTTASDSVILDETAPVIDDFSINGGAGFTNDAAALVTLNLSANDATSGVVSTQISNDAVFDEPVAAFAGVVAHVLEVVGDPANVSNDGTKTVRVQVRDLAGNVSTPAVATIELDRAPPTLDANFTIDCGVIANAANCTSSVVSLTVQSSNATEMAISNLPGLPDALFEPLADGVAHVLAPGDGTRSAFLLLRDAAGNVSAEFSDSIDIDTTPPSLGSVVINGGAAATNDATVTVDLSATGATFMRVAFDGVIDTEPLLPIAAQLTDDLPGVDGLKTVVAVFEDDAGNQSVAASDAIELDTLEPQTPTISVEAGADFTSSLAVTLALNATGATEMRVQTDGAFDAEPFVPFAASVAALLPPGDCLSTEVGCKEACVIFRDAAGNVTTEVCDQITLDSTPPAVPVITTASQVVGATGFAFDIAGEPADEFFAAYELVVDPGDNGVFSQAVPAGTTFNVTLTGPAAGTPEAASQDNLIRVRALDQAGNKSGEATLAVTVDDVAPATPVPSVTTATVNADTFAVFFDAANTSDDDANFDHYEIATNGGGFTPTALQDGLIFTLDQGDGVGCGGDTPCVNTLQVRAVDAANNPSPAVTVTVDEDSTVPTAPRFAPRGARISGLEARMTLEEISDDNGGEAVLYEIVGGNFPSFTEFAAQSIFPITLDRRDFSHELCVRGKDLAGNVSTADCVVIEQRSSLLLAAEGTEEENPAVFGDLIVYSDRISGLIALDIRTGFAASIDAGAGFTVPQLDGDENSGVLVYGDRLRTFDTQDAARTIAADACNRRCVDNLNNPFAADVSGDDVIVSGELGGVNGVFHTTVAGCLDPDFGVDCGAFVGTPDAGTRLTDVARNVQFCGDRDTGPRIKDRIVTWCEDNGGTIEIHRFDLDDPVDEVIATGVVLSDDLHQPVVNETHIYWASDADLCRIPHTEAAAALTGCPNDAHRVVTGQVGSLDAIDGERVAFALGGGPFVPRDVAILEADTGVQTQLTDDILDQEAISLFRDRVVYSDRQRFSQDIVLRELTEGTWAVVDPNLQAVADTNGKHITWLDTRNGGIQMFALDTETGIEFEVTPQGEQVTVGDSFYGLGTNGGGQHLVAYGITDVGTGVGTVFVQDLETGVRSEVPPGEKGAVGAVTMNREGTRIAWFNDDLDRIRTAPITGTTIGAITNIGAAGLTEVRHIAVAVDTVTYIDNQGGGSEEVRCADTAGNDHLLDNEARDVTVADVPALGSLVAAWGGANLEACELSCGAVLTCAVQTIALDFGGEVVSPKIASNGLMTFQSQTPSDGLGQIAIFDLVARERFKIASDFGVDGDAPVFDPSIFGDRVVWSGFAFGSSDIFTAVVAE
jgi:hypothetical protein